MYCPLIGSLTSTSSPARSPAAGGATSLNSADSVRAGATSGGRTFTSAVTDPEPTWQAASGVELLRHAPPSIDALAISPAGSLSVRSLTESPLLGLKAISVPRFAVEAAVAELGLRVSDGVPIDAPAAGASSAMAAITPTPAKIPRRSPWRI